MTPSDEQVEFRLGAATPQAANPFRIQELQFQLDRMGTPIDDKLAAAQELVDIAASLLAFAEQRACRYWKEYDAREEAPASD